MLRGSVRRDVEEFLAARSERLLETAYLLTGDQDRAEDLVQDGFRRTPSKSGEHADRYLWGAGSRPPSARLRRPESATTPASR